MPAKPEIKTCPKCQEDLPATLAFFYAAPSKPGGLAGWCKECMRARSREQYNADKVKARAYQKEYYAANSKAVLEKREQWLAGSPAAQKQKKVSDRNAQRKSRKEADLLVHGPLEHRPESGIAQTRKRMGLPPVPLKED